MSEFNELITDSNLLKSSVVANNRMNRGRGCLGGNSYQKDLSFNPIEFLTERSVGNKSISWLDICCGEGRALIETAGVFADLKRSGNIFSDIQIIGIDLAGMFCPYPSGLNHLTLSETPVEDYETDEKFDLVTCVHGLHYLGDKLSIIQKAARLLKEEGVFLANLDLKNLKLKDKVNSNKIFLDFFKAQGFIFDKRKGLLKLKSGKVFDLPFLYLGADDQAGPNYTGQPAIDSYYEHLSPRQAK